MIEHNPPRWLSGPVDGVPIVLQPVAHALLDAMDTLEALLPALDTAALLARPEGAASIHPM